jgi:hypothetical protein
MTRILETAVLDGAAAHWANAFGAPSVFSKRDASVAVGGREWAIASLFKADFKDEFAHLLPAFKDNLGRRQLVEFEAIAAERFSPRDDQVFANILAEKLAITPDGNHIPGRIGRVQVGSRPMGTRIIEVETLGSIRRRREAGLTKEPQHRRLEHMIAPLYWPIYAGEEEERADGGGAADAFPRPELMMALNTNIGIAIAIIMVDAGLDLLDQGTADGMMQGVSAAQPVDPDAALTGVVLFDLDLGTPAFAGATDQAPDAEAAAAAIAPDTSANATATLTHCRASSSNGFPTPLNAHIDGSAGVGTFDFVFNTDQIVSGATVDMTSWTFALPQGPTAT